MEEMRRARAESEAARIAKEAMAAADGASSDGAGEDGGEAADTKKAPARSKNGARKRRAPARSS
jgi:hypothetical protein